MPHKFNIDNLVVEPLRTRLSRTLSRPIVADVQIPYISVIVPAVCAIAFGLILYLGRTMDFFYDEWEFVLTAPYWSWFDYFKPHNEHWSTVPKLVYKALSVLIGARSYLPYLAVLEFMHVCVAYLLFLMIRRRAGDLWAGAACGLLLFLGRGFENILWAFQIGFLGSVAFGLLAILLLEQSRSYWRQLILVGLALLVSMASSDIGVAFYVVVAVELFIDSRRRHFLAALVVPGLAFGVWWLLIGQKNAAHDHLLSAAAFGSLVSYVPVGIGSAVAGTVGLSSNWSLIGFAALAALMTLRYRALGAQGLGMSAGLVAQYVLAGLARGATLGTQQASSSRYVYVGAVFVLLICSLLLKDLPWRGWWRPLLVLLGVVVFLHGASQLVIAAQQRQGMFMVERAELEAVWLVRSDPDVDRSARIDRILMPTVKVGPYVDARKTVGSDLPNITFEQLRQLPSAPVNEALRNVLPLRVNHVSSTFSGQGCIPIGQQGRVDGDWAGGTRLMLKEAYPASVQLTHWYDGMPPGTPDVVAEMWPNSALEIVLPRLPEHGRWRLRIQVPAGDPAEVCSVGE
ncbi:MAG TPA: hypothetical protein VFB34_12940 [Chloroflexota bacterium]|nr:hypothetical protein [Chloroflexota bacterium]